MVEMVSEQMWIEEKSRRNSERSYKIVEVASNSKILQAAGLT
jgi:hypothetical protein